MPARRTRRALHRGLRGAIDRSGAAAWFLALLLCLSFLAPSSSAHAQEPQQQTDATASAQSLAASETGLASWYGARFHQRRTASGEPFDMHALTAAHRWLPFDSRVCVRSSTGRSVVVRINDRGPRIGGRVIDLSRAAAQALGMLGRRPGPVALFALDEGVQDCPAP